jgi:STE24 endopeptidase
VSRILLLVLVFIWMAGSPEPSPSRDGWVDVSLFLGFYAALVLMLGIWSRMLARRVAGENFHRSVRWFNKVMLAARIVVPLWFIVGIWGLGWGSVVHILGDFTYRSVIGMVVCMLPAVATWMGLWWSQYPAERALREQNVLVELENDLPLYRPPAFKSYFLSNFRLQILFTLAPVALIILIRDALMGAILLSTGKPLGNEYPALEGTTSIVAAAAVFLFAPALLARVLNTSPMPDCPLRDRLDALCKRAGVRYRHILVWNTNNNVGNAAVMGVLPWLRYILLSDVLLERMNEKEIEAVFAHEMGHVVHRHMTWYAIYFVVAILAAAVAAKELPNLNTIAMLTPAATIALFLLFGALSRRCERQADVYAARTMEMLKAEQPPAAEGLYSPQQLATLGYAPVTLHGNARATPVGEYGAWLFASALRRVALINNMPLDPRTKPKAGAWNYISYYADAAFDLASNYLHGSITSRMKYVEELSADPRRTGDFDRTMQLLFCSLLVALFVSALFSAVIGIS